MVMFADMKPGELLQMWFLELLEKLKNIITVELKNLLINLKDKLNHNKLKKAERKVSKLEIVGQKI